MSRGICGIRLTTEACLKHVLKKRREERRGEERRGELLFCGDDARDSDVEVQIDKLLQLRLGAIEVVDKTLLELLSALLDDLHKH